MTEIFDFDNAATHQSVMFRTNYPSPKFNPNASYAVNNHNNLIRQQTERILDALHLPNGIICVTYSASHSAQIVADMFDGQVLCRANAHDSIFGLQKPYDSRCNKFCRVFTPVNNVTGICEFYDDETKSDNEYIAYDITAAIGRWYMDEKFWDKIDIAWLSGHKIGTEIGVGMLWLSSRVCHDFGFGENPKNNWGVFHGTVNTWHYYALANALEYANGYARHCPFIAELICALKDKGIDVDLVYNGGAAVGSIATLRFPGVDGEMLTDMLADKNIFVSKGVSACAYGDKGNRVLEYYGCENPDECIRVSPDPFIEDTVMTEYLVGVLADGIEEVIKIIKGE